MSRLSSLLFACALAACSTSNHTFREPATRWQTRTGQMQYQTGNNSIVGELTVSHAGQARQMEFIKAPAFSLVRLQSDETHVRIEGPLVRGKHEYDRSAVPEKLGGWVQVADRAAQERSFQVQVPGQRYRVQIAQ